eukprot:45356-Eustigmatos_ZCMA.PRE.1
MVVGQEKGAASSRASEEHHAPAAPEIRPIDRVAVARICSGQSNLRWKAHHVSGGFIDPLSP